MLILTLAILSGVLVSVIFTLYPTYDVDQSATSVHICGTVLWLGQYHDIALRSIRGL